MDQLRRRKATGLLFGAYCLMMLWLLFLRRIGAGPGVGQFNLQPMETVIRYLWVLRHSQDPAQYGNAMANLFGNVGLFLPLGAFLPILFSRLRKFWTFFLWSVLVILTLELMQAVTGLGTCDVDDVILNLAGTTLGWLLWRLFPKFQT